jgi:exopolyphosphatase/guanosine-5'-triphosphate,3'-diphosphate pyrophosphatase
MDNIKRVAIVDCGTNTFNLLIADISSEGWQIVFKNNLPVKLGAGGFGDKIIKSDRFARGLDAIYAHAMNIKNFGCQEVKVLATSAIREAANGKEFIQLVQQWTGLKIEAIDGDQEASLICSGVRASVPFNTMPKLIMDIGGGSTEFIIANDTEIYWKKSYLLGVSRIWEMIQPESVLTSHDIQKINSLLEGSLQDLREALKQWPCDCLVGSSGSFDTIAALYEVQKKEEATHEKWTEIPVHAYQKISAYLRKSTYEDRIKNPHIPAIRAEYMPLAVVLIDFVLQLSSFKKIEQSTYSLKEGVIVEWIKELQR